MTLIKFALMGAQGTGKSYIVDQLRARAIRQGIVVHVVTSPSRDIKRLGDFQNNHGLTWEYQMMLIAERRKRQYEAYERARRYDGDGAPHCLILADRCGLDEIAYMEEKVDLAQPKGFEQLFWEGPDAELARFTAMVKPFAMGTALWWDKVWFKPPHPGYAPIADDDRLDSKDWQNRVDGFMKQQFNLLGTRSNYTDVLNPDRDKAVENIWGTIAQVLGSEQPA